MSRKPQKWYDSHPNNKHWRTKADKLWSQIVRNRWPRCPICGNANTQAHHILTKGAYPQYRHELINGIGLCYQCHTGQKRGHISAHGTPLKFHEWLRTHCPDVYEWTEAARRDDGPRTETHKDAYERLRGL